MKITLKNVRLSFSSVFEQDHFKKYSGSFILEPGHPALKEIESASEEVGKAKWGAKWAAVKLELEAGGKMFLQNGNKKASTDGYAGNHFVSASNAARPTVVDRDRTPLAQGDGKPYSGCYVNAIIDVWAQDHKEYGKRINGQLQGIQFVKDGDKFGSGGVAESSDFEEIADGADSDDLV